MTRRISSRSFPAAPPDWDSSSRDAWNRLIKVLEQSDLFDLGRRTRPQFVIQGTVSAPVTLNVNGGTSNRELANIVGKLLIALQSSNFVDVR
jgi:hypothetical protein